MFKKSEKIGKNQKNNRNQARRKRGEAPSQFLAKQLTLSQPGGTDYVHHSTMSPPGFSDLATGLEI